MNWVEKVNLLFRLDLSSQHCFLQCIIGIRLRQTINFIVDRDLRYSKICFTTKTSVMVQFGLVECFWIVNAATLDICAN